MLATQYQQYIHLSRYARYREDLNRRETWNETVTRYCDFWKERFGDSFPYEEVYKGILNLDVMPSMRALMSAGPALARDEMAGYNCSFLPVNHLRSFDECLYILMCGTGVGFSVEQEDVNELPDVPTEIRESDTTIVVADSKIGWSVAFRQLLALLFQGSVPKWDLSKIRPAGARLKVFGGRASGPAPLDNLFRFTCNLIQNARGRRLRPIECHDLVCTIADCVIVGGVRRSALISLSDLSDAAMRESKFGNFGEHNPQRYLANNSAVYSETPDVGVFMKEWYALYQSKSGERGIFNRQAAKLMSESTGRRNSDQQFGTNPCGEIILRPNGLCNLSEVVVRSEDLIDKLKYKVRLASIIGTFQSTLTNFRYVRSIWKHNAEEERLLGVSLTGIMDHPILSDTLEVTAEILKELKDVAIASNKEYAERLGITPSCAITTVKPSGTVSQLVDSSSGIHPRHSAFYIRRVRADKKDPLARFMREKGFPVEDDISKPADIDVFSFPCKSPRDSVTRTERSAIAQLNHYAMYRQAWCEHNPSITVYIKEPEWFDVGAWVYSHFREIGGCAFLPYDGGNYRQAPYEEITEEEYNKLSQAIPSVDWTELKEEDDSTTGSQDLACLSGVCEIV